MLDGYRSEEWERLACLLCQIAVAHGDGKTKLTPEQFNFYEKSKNKNKPTDAASIDRRTKALSQLKFNRRGKA